MSYSLKIYFLNLHDRDNISYSLKIYFLKLHDRDIVSYSLKIYFSNLHDRDIVSYSALDVFDGVFVKLLPLLLSPLSRATSLLAAISLAAANSLVP